MQRFLKLVFAVASLPSAVFAAFEAGKGFCAVIGNLQATLFFCAGIALYFPAHFIFRGAAYVFAHETAHALAGLCCGYRVRGFSIGSADGQVTLDGSNVFVALAPYCVPVYALLCAAGYFAASLKWNMAPYSGWFTGAFGFFLCFHAVNTFELLWQTKQNDLKQAGGALFSGAIILAANSAVLLAAFKLLYPELIGVKAAGHSVLGNSAAFWQTAGHLAAEGALKLRALAAR
jgi:hypothetical protein